jgi:hypothetical protein
MNISDDQLSNWTKLWFNNEEDGVYKMLKSKIIEIENPGWDWFYE